MGSCWGHFPLSGVTSEVLIQTGGSVLATESWVWSGRWRQSQVACSHPRRAWSYREAKGGEWSGTPETGVLAGSPTSYVTPTKLPHVSDPQYFHL